MTSERSQAYGVALASFRDLEAAKFKGDPMELLTETADTLLFAATGEEIGEQLDRANALLDSYADNDRLMPETVERLKAELAAIGPQPAAALA